MTSHGSDSPPPTKRDDRKALPDSGSDRPTARDADRGGNAGETPFEPLQSFRGWEVIRAFEARGGEADLFLVGKDELKRVLKLYRLGQKPNVEAIEKIAGLAKSFPQLFVQICEFGFEAKMQRYFELLEFYPHGNLAESAKRKRFTESELVQIVKELHDIIATLHRNGILHLDFKPGNILVRSETPLDLVLTDFGIASTMGVEFSKKQTQIRGTSLYQSPESLSGTVGQKSDWWALGMIVLELLTGQHPFESLNSETIFYHLTTKPVPIAASVQGKWLTLIRGLLTRNDGKRWGADEVERWLAGTPVEQFFEADEPGRGVPPVSGGPVLSLAPEPVLEPPIYSDPSSPYHPDFPDYLDDFEDRGYRPYLVPFILFIASFVLWNSRVIFPIQLPVMFFREIAAAISAYFCGGQVHRIVLSFYDGCHLQVSGGNSLLILSGGFLGCLLLGVLAFLGAKRADRSRSALRFFGVLFLGATFLFVREWDDTTTGIVLGSGFLFLSMFLGAGGRKVLLRYLGFMLALFPLFEFRQLFAGQPLPNNWLIFVLWLWAGLHVLSRFFPGAPRKGPFEDL